MTITSCAPVRAFRKPRDRAPDCAREQASEDREEQVPGIRDACYGVPNVDRGERANADLALDADVEQACLEGQRDGQTAEDVGRGPDQRFRDRLRPPERPSHSPWYASSTLPPVATITTAPNTRAVTTARSGIPNVEGIVISR